MRLRFSTSLRTSLMSIVAVLLLLTMSGLLRGDQRQMEFVDGLIARGYYELAIDQLKTLEADPTFPQKEKELIPLKRGTAYSMWALVVGDPARQEQYLTAASKALDEFAAKHPTHPQILDVKLKKLDIDVNRAQALGATIAAEPDAAKQADIRKSVEEAYQKALTAAKAISDEAGKQADELRKRMSSQKEKFWIYFGAQLTGLLQQGRIEYLWAQLYPDDPKAKGSDERKKHLEAAVAAFQATSKPFPSTNLTFEAHLQRGIALRDLSRFQKDRKARDKMLAEAMSAFTSALTVERKPQTVSIRARANYEKAVTCLQAGQYEAAVTAVDGFFSETTGAANTLQGQQALLLKARALGAYANQIRTHPPGQGDAAPPWQDLYADARRAVSQVSPQYPKVREEADKLIQEWSSTFPAQDVIVASPILAAAEASKFYQDEQYDRAIDKCREVITLSAGKPQYASFNEEAWKTLGFSYYNEQRLYEADIAWKRLLTDFPRTAQGADLAWTIAEMYKYQYSQSENPFDLDRYLAGLQFFIEHFPRDPRVFGFQADSAKVYTLRGELLKAAAIWSAAKPQNPRYAEAMFNAGDLYRQAFFNLVDQGKENTPEAKDLVAKATQHFRAAFEAPPQVVEGQTNNYPAMAVARLAELLSDRKLPQPAGAKQVPALIALFREKFADAKDVMPSVLLAGVNAYAIMGQPAEADKLATEIEKDFGTSPAFLPAVQAMTSAWQEKDPARANAWRKKLIGPGGDLTNAATSTLINLALATDRQGGFQAAATYYTELVKRYNNPGRAAQADLLQALGPKIHDLAAREFALLNPGKQPNDAELLAQAHDFFEISLGRVEMEAGKYKEALPIYEKELARFRKAFAAQPGSLQLRNRVLTYLRSLALCQEEGGQPAQAIKLWEEFLGMTDQPANQPPEWFEARYHLANAYFKAGRRNDAKRLIGDTRTLYGTFGEDKALQKKVDALAAKVQ